MTSKKTYRIMHAVQTVAVIIIGLACINKSPVLQDTELLLSRKK